MMAKKHDDAPSPRFFCGCASSPVRFSTSTNRIVYPHRPQTFPNAKKKARITAHLLSLLFCYLGHQIIHFIHIIAKSIQTQGRAIIICPILAI